MIQMHFSAADRGWYWARPAAYSEAVRVFVTGFPGVKWEEAQGAWRMPRDAASVVIKGLLAAKIAKVRIDEGQPAKSWRVEDPDLRPYQNDGVSAILRGLELDGAFLLADDMGLGKTVQALVAADFLHVGKVLVICPKIMCRKWVSEGGKWLPDAQIVAVSSHVLRNRKLDFGLLAHGTGLVVVDEIHMYANPKAQRTEALAALLDLIAAMNGPTPRIGLSGTPIQNTPQDLWSPMRLLFGERFGSKSAFERRYCDGHLEEIEGLPNKIWVAKGVTRADELGARLGNVMLRRTKDQVLDELPPRTRSLLPIEIDEKTLKRQSDQARMLLERRSKSGLGDLLALTEASKIPDAAELARELVTDGHRPLLVCARKATAQQLSKLLKVNYVDGELAPQEREAQLAQAQIGIATMYSIEVGIDLVQFDCMIVVGLDWLYTRLLQVESRIHRLTSKRAVTIYYLIAQGSLDELVRDRVLSKLEAASSVLGATADTDQMHALLSGGTEEELIAALAEQIK